MVPIGSEAWRRAFWRLAIVAGFASGALILVLLMTTEIASNLGDEVEALFLLGLVTVATTLVVRGIGWVIEGFHEQRG